jgi:hypothetical protein
MDTWKDISDIIQKLVTSIGIIVGGRWTYFLFVRQRLGLPKLKMDLLVNEVLLPESTKLVHVELKILNVGSVLLAPRFAELRLRQVVPIPDDLLPLIKKGYDPIEKGKTQIEWPLIAGREWKWERKEFEIEPGEGDSMHADFVIPDKVKTCEFYCYIANSDKKGQGIGWPLTSIYNFNLTEDKEMVEDSKKQDLDEQQKQQKPQSRQEQQQEQQQQTESDKDTSN